MSFLCPRESCWTQPTAIDSELEDLRMVARMSLKDRSENFIGIDFEKSVLICQPRNPRSRIRSFWHRILIWSRACLWTTQIFVGAWSRRNVHVFPEMYLIASRYRQMRHWRQLLTDNIGCSGLTSATSRIAWIWAWFVLFSSICLSRFKRFCSQQSTLIKGPSIRARPTRRLVTTLKKSFRTRGARTSSQCFWRESSTPKTTHR